MTKQRAMKIISDLQKFVRSVSINDEEAKKTVILLRQLMHDFDVQLAMPSQLLPLSAKSVIASIELRKSFLTDRQLNLYEGIKANYEDRGYLTEREDPVLIGMYAQLNGTRLE